MRGAQYDGDNLSLRLGLIPACAGSTNSHKHILSSKRAHPRLCGEHSPIFQGALTTVGSSPLARGTRLAICGLVAGLGLIPARAGNTWVFRRFRAWTWAHPRLCGEHMLRTDGTKDALGSSPPVRGALASTLGLSISSGLIPARAGSTAMTIVFKLSQRAHPRPCGEHALSKPGV